MTAGITALLDWLFLKCLLKSIFFQLWHLNVAWTLHLTITCQCQYRMVHCPFEKHFTALRKCLFQLPLVAIKSRVYGIYKYYIRKVYFTYSVFSGRVANLINKKVRHQESIYKLYKSRGKIFLNLDSKFY